MKPITLRYTINGIRMKRTYAEGDVAAAKQRAAVLMQDGIRVTLTNLPPEPPTLKVLLHATEEK